MRLTTILREAVLDVVSGTTRAAILALGLAAAATVAGGADLLVVAEIQREAERFRDTGGSTLTYRLAQGIDGASCDGLRSIDGVSAAGAVRQRQRDYTPMGLPREPVPTFEISPSFGGYRALNDTRAGAGALISADVAEILGASRGSTLALTDGNVRVAGVFSYPSDGRRAGFGYSILVPSDVTAPYDECWVEAWPVSDELLSILPSTLTVSRNATGSSPDAETQGPQLVQLNASHGTRFDGMAAFESRITRAGPAVLGLMGFVLGAVSAGRRKLEIASSRHAGVSGTAIGLQLALETVFWATLSIVLALPALGIITTVSAPVPPEVFWDVTTRTLVVAMVTPALGTLARVSTIRESHLFSYFKTR